MSTLIQSILEAFSTVVQYHTIIFGGKLWATGSIVLSDDDGIASEFSEFAALRPQLPLLAVVIN